MWCLIVNSYANCQSSVSCNGLTEYFPINVGVKQGGIMSMIMYTCFINDLIDGIVNLNMGCHARTLNTSCVAYPDDIAILALHERCMQYAINYAVEYSLNCAFNSILKNVRLLCMGKMSLRMLTLL